MTNTKIDISKILYQDLMKCKVICISSKRNANGIYYHGINIEQFLFFLKEFNYSSELINFVNENKNKLDYILFDVGFDYSIKNDNLVIKKSGFYGTF